VDYRLLGRSKIKVSALGLGTMNFGTDWHGVGAIDAKTADRLLGLALDRGLTLIDTADVYGRGAAETMLGKLLGPRRKKIVLATKVCGEMVPGDPSSGGLSRRHILAAIDASLKRLKTDHVDLYMAHAPDPGVPIEETLEAFDRVVKAGKARAVGCSNFSGPELSESLAACKRRRWARFEFDQVQLSLACRFPESDLVPVCVKEKVGLLAWSPLGGGLLTGKYAAGGTGRRSAPEAFPSLPEAKLEGVVKVLREVARLEGVTPARAALGWLLAKPWLSSAIVGARAETQLEETLGAFALSPRAQAFLDRASALALSHV
jgi:aryl-alcohol dehydrogenase-like predicted oxidoreductase